MHILSMLNNSLFSSKSVPRTYIHSYTYSYLRNIKIKRVKIAMEYQSNDFKL